VNRLRSGHVRLIAQPKVWRGKAYNAGMRVQRKAILHATKLNMSMS